MQSAASGYIEPVRDDLMALLHEVNGQWLLGRNGGIHLLFADQVGPDQVRLVEAVARVIIDDGQGSLEDQVSAAFQLVPTLPNFEPASAPQPDIDIPELVRPENLIFDNGLGGFAPDDREYIIYLASGETTPAPWVNILANDGFGCPGPAAGRGFPTAVTSG